MEKAVLFMDYLNVSQKADSNYSHKGDKALDISGKDTGIDSLKAPFTGTIKRIYEGYCVWLESNEKVMYADGSVDYMTVLTMHDNNTKDLYVGKVIKQGEVYFEEGTRGNTTGNHIHITAGKGKFTGNGWYKNNKGNWCINNQIDLYKALYLPSNIKIRNDGGYNWIKTDIYKIYDTTYKVQKGDTLSSIAKKYNTTVDELVKLNNIKNKNLIKVGEVLILNGSNYFTKYKGKSASLVDALKSLNIDSSYTNRTKIANKNGITNYQGTATQNTKLLELLKQGKLKKL